jgi:hypothetical protein
LCDEEVGFAGSDDTWLVSKVVVTETGLDGRGDNDESLTRDLLMQQAISGVQSYERVFLRNRHFDDYYEAVLKSA